MASISKVLTLLLFPLVCCGQVTNKVQSLNYKKDSVVAWKEIKEINKRHKYPRQGATNYILPYKDSIGNYRIYYDSVVKKAVKKKPEIEINKNK